MEIQTIIQYNGKDINVTKLEQEIREFLIADGMDIEKIKDVTFYIKPEENSCSFVVTRKTETRSIEL